MKPCRSIWRSFPSIAALVLATVLGGCALPQGDERPRVAEPKRLTVTRTFLDHEVVFLSGRVEPAPGEVERLARFLDIAGAERGDRLVISAAARTDPDLAARRLARLEALTETAREGRPRPLVPRAAVRPSAGLRTERVRVLLIRHSVQVPRCPDWSIGMIGGADNSMSSNFGCANAVNLGLMIADPRDLVRGRDAGTFSGERAARAVERYRSGPAAPEAPAPSRITLDIGSSGTMGDQ